MTNDDPKYLKAVEDAGKLERKLGYYGWHPKVFNSPVLGWVYSVVSECENVEVKPILENKFYAVLNDTFYSDNFFDPNEAVTGVMIRLDWEIERLQDIKRVFYD